MSRPSPSTYTLTSPPKPIQVANVVGDGFDAYMNAFWPWLERGLGDFALQEETLRTALGALQDVLNHVGEKILPHVDPLMHRLIAILRNDAVRREVKPQVLIAMGDVALAVEDEFAKYLPTVTEMFHGATQLSINNTVVTRANPGKDELLEEYNAELRMGIMEGLAGILTVSGSGVALANHLELLLQFCYDVTVDPHASRDMRKAAVSLVGDLAGGVPAQVVQPVVMTHQSWIRQLLETVRRERGGVDTANYAWNKLSAILPGF
jgi:importin subunit beta-1